MTQAALVTGAAGDIGIATSRRLVADGYRVFLADINGARAEELAAQLRAEGAPASAIALDVTDERSVAAAFSQVRETCGVLDVLVNGAGTIAVGPFDGWSAADFVRSYEINVAGAYLCLREALDLLRTADGQARVVNLASVAGKRPGALIAPYACAKAAVISLTRSAAAALAPKIRVNCVCPGVVEGAMWGVIDARLEELGAPPSARFSGRVAAQPLPRAATTGEVAAAIAFLASPASSYIVGEDVNVDGGQLMH